MIKTLVIYDIANDKVRTKVGEACKDYGLERIQYSAFLGDINHNRRGELRQRLRRTLGEYDGNIQMYPLCEKDIRLKVEIINDRSKE